MPSQRLLLSFILPLMLPMPAAWAAMLELVAEAQVSGTYRLKDVARVTGDEAQKLGEMPVGSAPRPGHVDYLTQAQLTRIIESAAPQWRGKLNWQGNKGVAVRSHAAHVSHEKLVSMAQAALQAYLAPAFTRVEITPIASDRTIQVPVQAQLHVRPMHGKFSRRMAVWIDIQAQGRPFGAVPVWFEVKGWKTVPVAVRDLPEGTELKAEDFMFQEHDFVQGKTLVEQFPAGAMRLRTVLSRGAPLTTDLLETRPAISRNQEVAVRVAAGGIVIETSGIAQTNGQIGQAVKVKNAGSSEIFMAKVVEPGVVMVEAR